jgi:LAO/AO transport system kinase
VKTEATRGEGIPELLEQIDAHREHIEAEGTLERRRARNLRAEVIGLAAAKLRRDLEARAGEDEAVTEMLDRVVAREIDPATAARELLERDDGD